MKAARARKTSALILLVAMSVLAGATIAMAQAADPPEPLETLETLRAKVNQLHAAGKYGEAIPEAERLIALTREKHGEQSDDFAISLTFLGFIHQSQGHLTEAEAIYRRCLAIQGAVLEPNDVSLAATLNNLAGVLQTQGRYTEALPYYQRVLAIAAINNPGDRTMGIWLGNIANMFKALGRYDEAEQSFSSALTVLERALGREDADVAAALNNLAQIYFLQGRNAEAQSFLDRALAIRGKVLGPQHPHVAATLTNLGRFYMRTGRAADAESAFLRAIAILEQAVGDSHFELATALEPLALLYQEQGRLAEAELIHHRSRPILEKALGASHPSVANSLNNLALLYQRQNRFSEAEQTFQSSLAIWEKFIDFDPVDASLVLDNLATLANQQGHWARALDLEKRSTDGVIRRIERGSPSVKITAGGNSRNEAERGTARFRNLVKATFKLRLLEAAREPQMARDTFVTAQWAQRSEAAASLAQMAARQGDSNGALGQRVRERQDLVAEWQVSDSKLITVRSQPSDRYNLDLEQKISARLVEIGERVAEIDKQLQAENPSYAALSRPSPLSVEEVQSQLGQDEALVVLLDTSEWRASPEETFVWVVTKTDIRWVRSSYGSAMLSRDVAALRCGLDATAWNGEGLQRCATALRLPLERAPKPGEPLPFDLARAHALYKSLFGEVEDLIRDKRLLIVPSGALTSLPFHVLVTRMPEGPTSGDRPRQVALLGAQLGVLPPIAREQLKLEGQRGVIIVGTTAGGAAATAGLVTEDILLSVAGTDVTSVPHAVATVRSQPPHAAIQLEVLRGGNIMVVEVTLGATEIREWVPRLVDRNFAGVPWLIERHAWTVLPAVPSLKALRAQARVSQGVEPYIGFGNPLLTGSTDDDRRAWQKQRCPELRASGRTARAGTSPKSTAMVPRGLGDVEALRLQPPLPETADEVCAVARALGVGEPDRAVNLGERATEARAKDMSADGSLSRARVLHFATHGLVAAETVRFADTLPEPALLLTPPKAASEKDDGLLTASEVASLKLDADWVILSACNTAAGEGVGGDALSGLARAFFYAGARALLVSHWYVDSEATVALVTKSFAALNADPGIGRAEALRRAMRALTKGGGNAAHPSAWAPFVVVGEGGAGR